MIGADASRGWAKPRESSPVVLVTRVGAAAGSKAAAAALACAASEPDRAALLIDLDDGRAPRSSLVATAAARELEERIVAHMPDALVASRGQICRLKLPPEPAGIEQIPSALPLVRESAAIVHLPPSLLQAMLEEPRVRSTAALLRGDLAEDLALTALATRCLMARDLRVAVLKRPLGWVAARMVPFGVLPEAVDALPARLCERMLGPDDNKLRQCYDRKDGSEGDRQTTPRQERQGVVRARWRQGRHRSNGEDDR